ncbi:TetR/AcrR family transcriptional regulator [Brevibacillus humidisoli]|uniref:TetR/AcrR family transcriptional regulator n=1 Tax=Brevibacillus humidisoli TaxID=2895522 RepID=UPI001E428688|nr:TetR/AcrR family transcriptional regulator [Brevibacillus humidisoli]UFJ39533.1 TetR/AcrR family transcriptional regulator [Brevibacillus humidisoli]
MKGKFGTKGEASRARLLAAAAGQFAEYGFHGTRVSQIVAAAGLTQAAFYLYFPSKQAVFEELIESFGRELKELADAGRQIAQLQPADVPQVVRDSLQRLFVFFADNPDVTRVALFVAPEAEAFKRQIVTLVMENMRNNQAAGRIRQELAVEVAAECLLGMVERLTQRFLFTREKPPAELADKMADLFLHGILQQSGSAG